MKLARRCSISLAFRTCQDLRGAGEITSSCSPKANPLMIASVINRFEATQGPQGPLKEMIKRREGGRADGRGGGSEGGSEGGREGGQI